MTQDIENKPIQLDVTLTPKEFRDCFNAWNANHVESATPMTTEEAITFLTDNPSESIEAYFTENFEFFYNNLIELQDEEGNRE